MKTFKEFMNESSDAEDPKHYTIHDVQDGMYKGRGYKKIHYKGKPALVNRVFRNKDEAEAAIKKMTTRSK